MPSKPRPLDLIVRGINRVTKPIRQINNEINSMLAPVKRVNGALRGLSRAAGLPQLGKSVGNVGRELRALGGTALYGSAGIFAMAYGLKRFIDTGDDIGAVAAKVGRTAGALQEMRYAAEQLDVDQGQLDRGLEAFNKNVVDAARGTGRAAFAFQALGISVKEHGRVRDTGVLFDEFADKVAGIESPAVRARLAMAAFGDADMVNLLSVGAGKINELRQEARELGIVMSDETIAATGAADNELKRLSASARGLGYEIAAEVLPTIVEIAEAMRGWIQENRGWLKANIVPAIKNIASVLKVAIPPMVKFLSTTTGMSVAIASLSAWLLGPLAAALFGLGKNMLFVGVRVAPLFKSWIPWVIRGIGTLATKAIPMLLTGLRGIALAATANPLGAVVLAVSALVAGGIALYKHWEPFRKLIDGVWDRVAKIAAKASWLDFGFGEGPKPETAAEARAAMMGTRARDYAVSPQRWSGRVDIGVGVAKGATAGVRSMSSSSPRVALNTGYVMDPMW